MSKIAFEEEMAKEYLEKLYGIKNLVKSESPDWHNDTIGIEVVRAESIMLLKNTGDFAKNKKITCTDTFDGSVTVHADVIDIANGKVLIHSICGDTYKRDIKLIDTAIRKKCKKLETYDMYANMYLYIIVAGCDLKNNKNRLLCDVVNMMSNSGYSHSYDRVYIQSQSEGLLFQIDIKSKNIIVEKYSI